MISDTFVIWNHIPTQSQVQNPLISWSDHKKFDLPGESKIWATILTTLENCCTIGYKILV